jgi:cytochrome c553
MIPTRSTYLFALAVIPSLMVWTSEAFAQQKLGYLPGRGSYVRYCSSCHGDEEKETDPRLPR